MKNGAGGDILPARQSTRMAFLRLLSSTVGLGVDQLLVHVFMGSRRVEFLGEAQSRLKAMGPVMIQVPLLRRKRFSCGSFNLVVNTKT